MQQMVNLLTAFVHRKMATATLHFRTRLLRRCVHAWTREVHSQRLHGGKEENDRKRKYQQKLACFLSAVEKRETRDEKEDIVNDQKSVVEIDDKSEASSKPQDQQIKHDLSVAIQARLESNIWSTARKHVVCMEYKLLF